MQAKSAGEGAITKVMPLYYKIFMVLEREIRNRQYPPETPLPSELELAQRFDVSRVTIRHTLAMLAEKRLIDRQRGRGTFARPPDPVAPGVSSFDGLNQNIAEFETGTEVAILDAGVGHLPDWARHWLGLGPLDTRRIARVRRDGAGPFSYSICHLSGAAAQLDPSRLGNRAIIAALADVGVVAERVEQRLTAVAAAPEIAEHLDVVVGAPLTLMRRVMFDAMGEAFEFLEVYYRPDRFEYSVNLTRQDASSGPPHWVSKGD